MALKNTKILTDDPADDDKFGTHKKLAEVIEAEILNAQYGRSIAIVGDWGSGKSTIINLLRRRLMSPELPPAHVFIYDAWAHQGDQLRRAFLDDLIASLQTQNLISLRQARKATDKIWNRVETTTTTIEPLMRRHAKWLLFMLALIPFGWKLFDIPAASEKFWCDFFTIRNVLGALMLLALPLSVGGFWLANKCGPKWLKKFFFDDDYKNDGFSVLSFFLEKVSGKAERKRIKSPADSIGEFRGVFSKLLIYMQGKEPNVRLVIVIDNIDRIPADQAREFWSTMQTFFGDGGGSRKSFPQKYWLIAPFSEQALASTFQDKPPKSGGEKPVSDMDDKAQERMRSYIDKTFGLAFYVPPPILAHWRKYLLDRLKEAFFEHDEHDLLGVRDLYDYTVRGAPEKIMPRSMKLFVNALVALYRQRGDEIPLPIMAIYELRKSAIKKGEMISAEFLSADDRRVIDWPEWRSQVGALQFGVTPKVANQLLLQEPMIAALREGAGDKLKQQEDSPGFFDILPGAVFLHIGNTQPPSGAVLAQTATVLDHLEGKADSALNFVWQSMRKRLPAVTWENFGQASAKGVSAIIAQTPQAERGALRKAVVTSFAQSTPPERGATWASLKVSAVNWLELVAVVIEPTDSEAVSIPGTATFAVQVLEQLVSAGTGKKIAERILPAQSVDELVSAIVENIAEGRPPEMAQEFISHLESVLPVGAKWADAIAATSARLSAPIADLEEFTSQLRFLNALAANVPASNALAVVKELSSQGHLPHYYRAFRRDLAARAEIMVATLLANPSYERANEFQNSGAGDGAFRPLFETPTSDGDIVAAAAEIFERFGISGHLITIATQHAFSKTMAVELLAGILKNPEGKKPISLSASAVLGANSFFYEQRAKISLSALISRLVERPQLVQLLSEASFDVGFSFMYAAVLNATKIASERDAYLAFIKSGIDGLDSSAWERLLLVPRDSADDILSLCLEIRALVPMYSLRTAAQDAILAQVRNVGAGTLAISDELKERLEVAVNLLDSGLRASLGKNVVDDMIAEYDAKYTGRILLLFNSQIMLGLATDRDQVARRILSPIVSHPETISVAWVNRFLESNPSFLVSLSSDSKTELIDRTLQTLANEQTDEVLAAELHKTKSLLGIKDKAKDVADGKDDPKQSV